MVAKQTDSCLVQCRQQIEQTSGLGNSAGWTTADFERLSEAILQRTGACLSVTTLKRVWGKIRYESSPTTTTLNVLVQYLGYPNWHDFQGAIDRLAHAGTAASNPLVSQTPVFNKILWPTSRLIWMVIATGLIGLLALVLISGGHLPVSPLAFSFRSRPVTQGIPNSVVFDYDATASPTDSVFIQQSWDASRRELVSRTGHQHTSIYYHPGYFRAKLVVGKQVVREHDLLIRSNGWHVALLQEPVPVYFKTTDVIQQGRLQLPIEQIRAYHIPLQPQPPLVRYRYINELGGLRSDNFVLETRLRNDYQAGAAACQHTRLLVHGKNEMFIIPLSAKGCISDLYLRLAGHEVAGRDQDLSAFGVDFAHWVDFRLEVIDKRARIWVNGRLAYQVIIPTASVELVGVTYEFAGTGSVDFCRFKRSTGEVVYEDTFETTDEGHSIH